MPTWSSREPGIISFPRRMKTDVKIPEEWLQLIEEFNRNWTSNRPELAYSEDLSKWIETEDHPFLSELKEICLGTGGTLPYFNENAIIWCSLADTPLHLKQQVESLQAWIIPSYGWVGRGDGYLIPDPQGGGLQPFLNACSPHGYFKWRSSLESYQLIESKLKTRRTLLAQKPKRERSTRLSLYELRSSFQTALLAGNPQDASAIIDKIDQESLDSASNTQMMRIRLWHKFREFEKIRNFKHLDGLQLLPSLPKSIRICIDEALGKEVSETPDIEKEFEKIEVHKEQDIPSEETEEVISDTDRNATASTPSNEVLSWSDWFELIVPQKDDRIGDELLAYSWLDEKERLHPNTLKASMVKKFADSWETVFLNEQLIANHRILFNEAVGKFIEDFVQGDDHFPRNNFSELYLSLMRIWGQLRGGQGGNQEAGHVLLELGRALLQFNHNQEEAKSIIEDWWSARPTTALLPFALDAIELLHSEHPDSKASENLWVEAADVAKRNSDSLLESEKILWRKVGSSVGFDEQTIHEFFPLSTTEASDDPLKNCGLKKVSIVCMRETQAKEAKKIIEERSDIQVSIISSKVAGDNTTQARSCDVVLFVWLATSHAVFRAFDGFDRNKLCYVQGTGISSIVRSLERWIAENQEAPVDFEAA
jgi:hypothetical protein